MYDEAGGIINELIRPSIIYGEKINKTRKRHRTRVTKKEEKGSQKQILKLQSMKN